MQPPVTVPDSEEEQKISRFIGTIQESAIAALIYEFDTECMKAYSSQSVEMIDTVKTFISAYNGFKLYTFCTDESLQSINMLFMRDVLLIDFVMNLTERTVFAWYCMEETLYMDMVRSIVTTQIRMKGGSLSNALVLSPQIVSGLEVDHEKVMQIFQNNPVLVVLYVLFANFRQTLLYKVVSEAKFKDLAKGTLTSQQPTGG